MKLSRRVSFAIGAAMVAPAACMAIAQYGRDADDEAINYAKAAPHDAITRLQERIDKGEVTLAFRGARGYLDSVLKALGISTTSQMLVFSKTSFQAPRISPSAPRALYFDDNTYIGWVQGRDVVEISTVDPQLGAVFYLLPQTPSAKPRFIRQDTQCLQCHDSSTMTGGVPGHIMRSIYPRADGQPEYRAGTFITTDQSPFEERWGGWYVTGTHGPMRHMGNSFVQGSGNGPDPIDRDSGANITDLSPLLDTSPYLAKTSDIVALMVAEHQTRVQNLITKCSYETRIALRSEQQLNKELDRPADFRSESTMNRIKNVAESLVQALLMCKEAPLTAPVQGTSGFSIHFAAQGPRDRQGRSLRELELRHRLFKYPCSYQIYSAAFDAIPPSARDYVYQRLADILSGKDTSVIFAHLASADRRAILDILIDTKPDFARWLLTHASSASTSPTAPHDGPLGKSG